MPWSSADRRREKFASSLVDSIHGELYGAGSARNIVHIHVNGPGFGPIAERFRHPLSLSGRALVTGSDVVGKTNAVRFGAEVATDWGADVLIVVDNDVRLSRGSLRDLLQAFNASSSGAASALKAPLVDSTSTDFQRLYSYAVLQSFQHSLFTKRPTGSLYAVAPSIASLIFQECGEGISLQLAGALNSGVVVQSPYAPSFESEVDRRARHHFASLRSGIERLHAKPWFAAEAERVQLPASIDRDRFIGSLRLWAEVHSQAAKESK